MYPVCSTRHTRSWGIEGGGDGGGRIILTRRDKLFALCTDKEWEEEEGEDIDEAKGKPNGVTKGWLSLSLHSGFDGSSLCTPRAGKTG